MTEGGTPTEGWTLGTGSIRARLTGWILVLLLVRATLIIGAIYWAFQETATQHLDSHAQEEILEFQSLARARNPIQAWQQFVEREGRPDRRDFFSIRIWDAADREIVASGVFARPAWRRHPFPSLAEPEILDDPPHTLDDPAAADESQWRLYSAELVDLDGNRYTMHLAADLSYLQRYNAVFNTTTVTVAVLATLLGMWVAWWLIGRAMQPLQEISTRIRGLGLRSLEDRLPTQPNRDEVAVLVAGVNQMLDRLQRSVERLQQFTADAAHELRTPVAAAFTSVQVTLRQPRKAEEYRAALAGLVPTLEQLAVLGRDMGLLADMDSDRLRLNYADANANAIVNDVVDFLGPVAEDKGLRLEVLPAAEASVICDVTRIRQVVFNLLENAIKYTPPARTEPAPAEPVSAEPASAESSPDPSGSSDAIPAAGRITIDVDSDAKLVRIRVTDTGPGIPAEHLGRLFDRFYRLERDRDRRTGGSGLGLAIVRSLVRAHGGSITVTSRVGVGTAFTVALPRQPSGRPVPPKPPKPPESAGHRQQP